MNLKTIIFLTSLTILPASNALAAAPKVVPVEGMQLIVKLSIQENLQKLVGKDVHCSLRSGETVSGKVKAVANNLVHLEKLSGQNFNDALVRIDEISSLKVRSHQYEKPK